MSIPIIELEIAKTEQLGEDAIAIYLNNTFDYQSGQFVTFIIPVEGKEERRCYSLFTSPETDDMPGVMIKRVAGGKVSGFLIQDAKPGKKYKGMPPLGSFTTSYDRDGRHVGMVAAGSGITPLFSILKSVLKREPESKVTLFYVNRNQDRAIFFKELQALETEFSGRFMVKHHFTVDAGRPDAQDISTLFTRDTDELFICGPDGLMHEVQMAAADSGIPSGKVRKESFTAGVTSPTEVITPDDEKSEVTILMDGDEYTLKVAPEESILFTALDNGIDMPFSCQSGVCTACRCKVLEGKVEMETSDGLSDEEIEEGYVLTCVGHPGAGRVKLEVD